MRASSWVTTSGLTAIAFAMGHRSSDFAFQKQKEDVIEHAEIFDHVGLLSDKRPGPAELPLACHPANSFKLSFSAKSESSDLGCPRTTPDNTGDDREKDEG